MTVLLQQVSAHGLMCQLVRSAVGTRQSLLQSKTSRCFFYSTVDWLIQPPASLIVREATGTFKLSVRFSFICLPTGHLPIHFTSG